MELWRLITVHNIFFFQNITYIYANLVPYLKMGPRSSRICLLHLLEKRFILSYLPILESMSFRMQLKTRAVRDSKTETEDGGFIETWQAPKQQEKMLTDSQIG